jgi:alkaline phosphatase
MASKRKYAGWIAASAGVAALASVAVTAEKGFDDQDGHGDTNWRGRRAKNVILFIGDGMGVSTVTATRIYSVGVAGQLVVDQFPQTALSRTYSSDSITPDSAPTMTAMMTGTNTNAGVLGLDDTTEYNDFNGDGDGRRLRTLLEEAKRRDMRVGVVSTARITHATPAATYAHINNRDNENAIALQALPGDPTYNQALGDGIDVLFGGGRRHFVPNTLTDEEAARGSRSDGRDLRLEFQNAGYTYVDNAAEFNTLSRRSLPVLGLFESSHMEWEYDRPSDAGGEPSLTAMTLKAIDLLARGQRRRGSNRDNGYFLMVEGGRIDHAHHDGNGFRALHDTQELDQAIGAAAQAVDLRDTLIIVSADHSHAFNIVGYPLRPREEMPYPVQPCSGSDYGSLLGNGVLDLVYDVTSEGCVAPATDADGVPYAALVYGNGPGFRGRTVRVDPTTDSFLGIPGAADLPGPNPSGFAHQNYRQEAAVPLLSETHTAEEVAIYAIGAGAELVRGTVKNTFIYRVMARALGF